MISSYIKKDKILTFMILPVMYVTRCLSKCSPKFSKRCPKSSYLKVMFSKISSIVAKYSSYFGTEIYKKKLPNLVTLPCPSCEIDFSSLRNNFRRKGFGNVGDNFWQPCNIRITFPAAVDLKMSHQ